MLENKVSKKMILTLASSGGALEMYDFVIYIFFASVIAKLFFPLESRYAAMLSTLAIFATGYLARPIGGIIFGHLGDRYGRQKGLLITILVMGLSVLAMALMPTYSSIGIAAPILFCFFRLLQGIALGGDLPGAITFVNEYADRDERGLMTGFLYMSINVGILFASFVGALCVNFLSPADVMSWGWRAAFLVGLVLFVVGYYLRSKNIETPLFREILDKKHNLNIPAIQLFRWHLLNVVRAIAMVALQGVIIVQLFLFMPTYLEHILGVSPDLAMIYNTINLVVFSACIPLFGHLSDRISRKYLLMAVAFAFLVLTFPLYALLAMHHTVFLWIGLLGFALLSSCAVAIIPVTLTELFPTVVRNSGVAISYNIGFAIFGGLSPLMATFLIHHFHNPLALGINLTVVALILVLFLLPMQLPKNQVLR